MKFKNSFFVLMVSIGMGLFQNSPALTAEKEPPTYKGRTFETWGRLLVKDLDWETRADAYRALSTFSVHDPETYLGRSQQLVKTNLPKEKSGKVLEVGYSYLAKWSAKDRLALQLVGLQSDQLAHRRAAARGLAMYYAIPTKEATLELAETVIDVIKKEMDIQVRDDATEALTNLMRASEYEYDWSDGRNPKSKKIRPEGESGPIVKKAIPVIDDLLKSKEGAIRAAGMHATYSLPSDVAVELLANHFSTLTKNGNIQVGNGRGRVITDDERFARDILSRLAQYGGQAKPVLPTLERIRRDYSNGDSSFERRIRSTIEQIKNAKDRAK